MGKTKGVGFYGKVRIPTIGHREAINTAKTLAQNDSDLHIGLSGTSNPLTPELKRRHAEMLFNHPVMPASKHTSNIISFLKHMASQHDDFTLVAGSDRAKEYHALLSKYNGKPDQSGVVPFHFKKWRVHQVDGQRTNVNKHPTQMNKEELTRSVSATKLEKLARSGDWKGFKAYHPGIPATHVKQIFDQIRMSKEEVEVPNIGMTLSRDLMPQIDKEKSFLSYLKKKGIDYTSKTLPTKDLKSSQSEFDINKIADLMLGDSDKNIITSNDGYVMDGHHRWLADHNNGEKTDAWVIDLPILELIRTAKEYTGSLQEDTKRCDLDGLIDQFAVFCSGKLGISKSPHIVVDDDNDSSFGGYHPGDKTIHIVIKNRHPMDIFRTIAHELVHHKQNEDDRIGDVARDGDTGSDIENEANAVAGQIMRHWAKENPHHFKLSALTENIAVFVVGGPCSGKDKIIRTLKEEITNEIDILSLSKARTLDKQVIINGSANELNEILKAKNLLESNGYHTSLIFVDVTNDISKLRNEERQKRGQRVISESIRFNKYVVSQENKQKLQEQFGEDMTTIDNSMDKRFDSFLKEEGKEQKSKPKDREWGTDSLTKIYKATTPGQSKKTVQPELSNYPENNVGVGPTYGGATRLYMEQSVKNWMDNPATQARFKEKYGALAEKKLFEAAYNLSRTLKEHKNPLPKTIRDIRESSKEVKERGIFGAGAEDTSGGDSFGEDRPSRKKRYFLKHNPKKL